MKKVTSALLALGMAVSMVPAVFAAEATVQNSIGSAATDIDAAADAVVGNDATQGEVSVYDDVLKGDLGDKTVEVYASKSATYTVRIPKTIILSGETGVGEYTVAVKGDIEGMKQITVAPYKDADTAFDADNKLVLSQANKADITAAVVQEDQAVVDADMSEDEYLETAKVTGTITVDEGMLTAGSWSGSFLMHISYDDKI